MKTWQEQVDRGIDLLKLCQQLQSEKDGVDRPDPFIIDKTKVLDEFAQDIGAAITNMAALHKLIPQMMKLAELGRRLADEGRISVDYGDDYSTAALDYVCAQYGK
ncbi:MAG: hypothetical protein FWC38_06430 [Proteobacteria bacterium]|nr:hypothetical protein [Pseudomonadota bacterium]MCL2307845.1 hypothetical protein [Pseudomonadota bacterium]